MELRYWFELGSLIKSDKHVVCIESFIFNDYTDDTAIRSCKFTVTDLGIFEIKDMIAKDIRRQYRKSFYNIRVWIYRNGKLLISETLSKNALDRKPIWKDNVNH